MSELVVLLDFDGTLAERPGLWAGCVMELLEELEPEHHLEAERVRAGLRDGFPWHRPEEPHPHLSEPAAWWAPVQLVGDNPLADVRGAEAVGLPAILIRRPGAARRRAEDLAGAVELILAD